MKNKLLYQLKQVQKVYQTGKLSVPALINIDLTIKQGEMVAIMGPSGSGKSTLMNLLGLLDRPSAGQMLIDDQPIDLSLPDNQLAKLRNEKIGFVFQSFQLLSRLNAIDNVLVPTSYLKNRAKSNRAELRQRGLKLLEQVGLASRALHKPNELSGGEKQRVAIARALINDPEIILADEPTGNLDSKSGSQILDLLSELHKDGKTIVLITHDPKVAARCQRTIHILDGQIQERN